MSKLTKLALVNFLVMSLLGVSLVLGLAQSESQHLIFNIIFVISAITCFIIIYKSFQ